MRRDLFLPTPEGEGRLLLLIDAFSTPTKNLEGRTKLAKLDFLIRYPAYFRRALALRAPLEDLSTFATAEDTIEVRMVRFRYGPWDPAYFALLGSLIGRGLVVPVSGKPGVAYRTTAEGADLARRLASSEPWKDVYARVRLLKRHFDRTGEWLKDFVYSNFPEVTSASWGEDL